MKLKLTAATAALALSSLAATPVQAQTEIQWWHAMSGALGEWVNDLAKDFNNSQKNYKVVPVFKGTYDEAMTAAVAAFRAGNSQGFVVSQGAASEASANSEPTPGRTPEIAHLRQVVGLVWRSVVLWMVLLVLLTLARLLG